MIEIDLPTETEARLTRLAAETGRSVADCAIEAIERLVAPPAPGRFSYGERMIATMMADWLDSLASGKQMTELRRTLAPMFVVQALRCGRDTLIGEHYAIATEGFAPPGTLYQTLSCMLDDLAHARKAGEDVPLFTGISDNAEADALAEFVCMTHPDYTHESRGVHFDPHGVPQPLAYWLDLAARLDSST